MLRACLRRIWLNISTIFLLDVQQKKSSNNLKRVKGVPITPLVMKLADKKARTALEKANMFNEYLISVYNPADNCQSENLQHSLMYDFDTSPEKACVILRKLNITKATGPDSIPPCFLRVCAEELARSLSFILRKAKETGKFPSCWKISCIKPLHKEGAKDKVANYRPVALLSCISNVFEKCIYNKLLKIVEPHPSNCQFGFRGGRSSAFQLLFSPIKIAESKDSSKTTHAVYLDLKKNLRQSRLLHSSSRISSSWSQWSIAENNRKLPIRSNTICSNQRRQVIRK